MNSYQISIQSELDRTKVLWNTHYIRSIHTPAGKPNILFHLPGLFGAESYLKPLDDKSLDILSPILTAYLSGCRIPYKALFDSVVEQLQPQKPTSLREAAVMLSTALDAIEHDLQNL